jgi:hypothetical protein
LEKILLGALHSRRSLLDRSDDIRISPIHAPSFWREEQLFMRLGVDHQKKRL